jgi:membrane protease YdiL (CAAX protease family)
LPLDFASSGVALVFLASTYALCLRVHHEKPPAFYGLSLAGLMEPNPVSPRRVVRELLAALGVASLVALVVFPPFWFGFIHWHAPTTSFNLARAFVWEGTSAPVTWLVEMSLWHVLGVALPEEAFFRGYLPSSLRERWKVEGRQNAWAQSAAIIASSALFALGHLATEPHPARLAVFFPSLLFGVVRERTGGIGASLFLHAQCNLFSQWLAQGYGLY